MEAHDGGPLRFYWFGFWIGMIWEWTINDIRKQIISKAYQRAVRRRPICSAGSIMEELRFSRRGR